MANIDQSLPSGRSILANPAQAGAYGDHLRTEAEQGLVNLVQGSHLLASFDGATYSVDLPLLDRLAEASRLVPYVNTFLGGEGRVEKYWRTKTYRIAGQPAPVQRPSFTVQPRIAGTPSAAVAPTVATTVEAPVAAVAVESTPDPQRVTDIPGVEVPKKVSVKRYRKGWMRVGQTLVREDDLTTLQDAWALRQAGVNRSVLITGPAGTAKTMLVREFAASLGVPFLKVDGGAIRTADDWAGAFRQDPATRIWSHRWSPFAQVLRLGQPCVILVDEITRTESPQALNAFMGLLDWTGALLVPDAHSVLRLPAGVLVVATANIGPEFVGTLPLDGAVRQRFADGIRMAYPDEEIEATLLSDLTGIDPDVATRLVTMAVTQRANRDDPQMYPSGSVISTRVLLDICRRITTCSRDPRAVVVSTLAGQFDPGDQAALSVAIDTQFPAAPIEEDDEVDESDEASAEQGQPWTCPSCGRSNTADMVVCWGPDCTYVRPTGGGTTIRLQNTSYAGVTASQP